MRKLHIERLPVKQKLGQLKKCELCSSDFKMARLNQRYCSIECNRKASNALSKERRKKHLVKNKKINKKRCKSCGDFFLPKTKRHGWCSTECYRETTKKVRDIAYFLIFERDGFRCQYCGKTPQDKIKLVVDHIYPVKKGGKGAINNLITSCDQCNSDKSDKVLSPEMLNKFWDIANKGVNDHINYEVARDFWKRDERYRCNRT